MSKVGNGKHVFYLAIEFDGDADTLRRNVLRVLDDDAIPTHAAMGARANMCGETRENDGSRAYDFDFLFTDDVVGPVGLWNVTPLGGVTDGN